MRDSKASVTTGQEKQMSMIQNEVRGNPVYRALGSLIRSFSFISEEWKTPAGL